MVKIVLLRDIELKIWNVWNRLQHENIVAANSGPS